MKGSRGRQLDADDNNYEHNILAGNIMETLALSVVKAKAQTFYVIKWNE